MTDLLLSSPYILLIVLIVGIVLFKSLASASVSSAPKLERKPLLTKAELRFWSTLLAAFPDHVVAPQVAMGALLKPRGGQDRSDYMAARGRFSQKIVDFAVIDPVTGDVLALIELDDSSHNAVNDAARDALLAQGNYRLFRFANKPWPSVGDVRARMDAIVPSASVAAAPRKARS